MSATQRNIIVPMDGSDAAHRAAGVALELGEAASLPVHLLHVHPFVHGEAAGMARLSREAIERAANDAASRAFGAEAERVSAERRHVRWGDPVEEILGFLGEHEPALVLMGRGQQGTLERLLVGSVSDGVLRRCGGVPVTLVR
jgi:nucleotide-binding universal stress UspA family protein